MGVWRKNRGHGGLVRGTTSGTTRRNDVAKLVVLLVV